MNKGQTHRKADVTWTVHSLMRNQLLQQPQTACAAQGPELAGLLGGVCRLAVQAANTQQEEAAVAYFHAHWSIACALTPRKALSLTPWA